MINFDATINKSRFTTSCMGKHPNFLHAYTSYIPISNFYDFWILKGMLVLFSMKSIGYGAIYRPMLIGE